jgi:hypothetical protein
MLVRVSRAGDRHRALPIYLAYISAIPTAQAGDASLYTNAAWTNSTLVGRFSLYSPSVTGSANTDLQTTARIQNALTAGLPSNYFRMNPAIGTNASSLRSGSDQSQYDSVVLELRRRLSRGLLISGNYTQSWRKGTTLDSLSRSRAWVRSTGEVPWAFKMTANYEVPVGRGRRYGADMNRVLDGIVGNWSFNMTGRVQSGRVLTTTGRMLVGCRGGSPERCPASLRRRRHHLHAAGRHHPQHAARHDVSATSPTGYGALGPPRAATSRPAHQVPRRSSSAIAPTATSSSSVRCSRGGT